MHIVVLILAWISPAAIAGALGWKTVWGAGSAFGDYLIPIPVAGGVFHVPSFVVAAAIILASRHSAGAVTRFLPALSFGVLAGAITLMLEFDRLNAWFFTDYEPAGSPLRLDENPLLLFVASDAFWVGAYALMRGFKSPAWAWPALCIVPTAIIAAGALDYRKSGPVFELGGPMYTSNRGEEIVSVYTSASYDEALFLKWVNEGPYSLLPWNSVNAEHTAVIFTNSMQVIRWGQVEQLESEGTVATVCLYEEDQSMVPHRGYHDCFEDRNTVEQDLAELVASESTGLGDDVDRWYARARLCDEVELPENGPTDIARIGICRGMIRVHARDVGRLVEKYGADSEQVQFVRAQAAARGLTER